MKVKITRSSHEEAWYSDKVGQAFQFGRKHDKGVVVYPELWPFPAYLVLKGDYELVK